MMCRSGGSEWDGGSNGLWNARLNSPDSTHSSQTVNSSEHIAQSMLTGANRRLGDKGGEAERDEIFGQVRLRNIG